MLNRTSNQNQQSTLVVPGVIDTIGLAYTRLIARPWVVLGPILLDLYLWLGLRVTAGPLVMKVAGLVDGIDEIGGSLAGFLEDRGQYNLAELLSLQLFTVRVPSFVPLLVDADTVRISSWDPTLADGQWWLVLMLGVLFAAVGFIGGAAYLQFLGDVATNRTRRFDPADTALVSLRLLLWLAASAALLILIAWPLLVAQAGLIVAGSGFSGFLAFLLVIPAGLGFLMFFFSVFAIVLDRATAIEAFRSSYRVVRAFGWQSLGFIVSYMIVTGGFPYFWRMLVDEPPGTMIAIIGNAFISSGMIAAGMIYYEDRAAILAPQTATG